MPHTSTHTTRSNTSGEHASASYASLRANEKKTANRIKTITGGEISRNKSTAISWFMTRAHLYTTQTGRKKRPAVPTTALCSHPVEIDHFGQTYRYLPGLPDTHCAYLRRNGQAELPGWSVTYQKTVAHPSTNRARCRATSLIENRALPLCRTRIIIFFTLGIYSRGRF